MITSHCFVWLAYPCPKFDAGLANLNTLRPRQNGRHFADDTFKRIFVNENVRISIKVSLKLFLRVQWTILQHCFRLWLGAAQLLSEPMLACSPSHICVSRPQWINLYPLDKMLFHKLYVIGQNQPIMIKDFKELILPVTYSKLGKQQRSGFRFP